MLNHPLLSRLRLPLKMAFIALLLAACDEQVADTGDGASGQDASVAPPPPDAGVQGLRFFSDGSEYPPDHAFADYARLGGSNQTMSLQTVSGQRVIQLDNPQEDNFYFRNVHMPSVGAGERIQLYAVVRYNEGPTVNTPHLALAWAEPATGRQAAELYAHSDSYRYVGWKGGRWFESAEHAVSLPFSDGDVLHFVLELEDGVVRQKGWLQGDAEPAFVEYEDADLQDFAPGVMAFGGTQAGQYQIIEWGLGFDTEAPRSASEVSPPREAPALEVMHVSDTTATVAFVAPRGSRWSEYRYRRADGEWSEWLQHWDLSDIGLDSLSAETPYDFEMRSLNIRGAGPAGAASILTTREIDQPEGSRAGDEAFLVDLANAMDSDNWTNNRGWSKTSMSLSDDIFGIEARMVDGELRVVSLDLQTGTPFSNDLRDADLYQDGQNLDNGDEDGELIPGREFPESVANLTECEYFNVKSNKIRGPIPQGITNLVNARRILLSGHWREPDLGSGDRVPYNHPVSSATGKTTEGRNFWSGEIPRDVHRLQALEVWESMQAGITGTIPPGFGELPNLQMLMLNGSRTTNNNPDLSRGYMTGPIPPEIFNAPLRYFFFGGQNQSGEIPPEIGSCTTLQHIRIGNVGGPLAPGGLEGEIPEEMGNIPDLRLLTLSSNQLTGGFPEFLFQGGGHNSRLHTVSLTANNLSGELPATLDPSSSLNVIGLSRNNFHGRVPAWIAQRRIIQLNLSFNNFSSLHSEFFNPDAVIWSGTNGTNGRIRNVRLQSNPDLSGDIPRPNWLVPSNFHSGAVSNAGSIATFRDTGYDSSSWNMMEDGREYDSSASDRGNSGPIVRKTRREWYEHFWNRTRF